MNITLEDIYDLSTKELEECLIYLRNKLKGGKSGDSRETSLMLEIVMQELEERNVNHSILSQLDNYSKIEDNDDSELNLKQNEEVQCTPEPIADEQQNTSIIITEVKKDVPNKSGTMRIENVEENKSLEQNGQFFKNKNALFSPSKQVKTSPIKENKKVNNIANNNEVTHLPIINNNYKYVSSKIKQIINQKKQEYTVSAGYVIVKLHENQKRAKEKKKNVNNDNVNNELKKLKTPLKKNRRPKSASSGRDTSQIEKKLTRSNSVSFSKTLISLPEKQVNNQVEQKSSPVCDIQKDVENSVIEVNSNINDVQEKVRNVDEKVEIGSLDVTGTNPCASPLEDNKPCDNSSRMQSPNESKLQFLPFDYTDEKEDEQENQVQTQNDFSEFLALEKEGFSITPNLNNETEEDTKEDSLIVDADNLNEMLKMTPCIATSDNFSNIPLSDKIGDEDKSLVVITENNESVNNSSNSINDSESEFLDIYDSILSKISKYKNNESTKEPKDFVEIDANLDGQREEMINNSKNGWKFFQELYNSRLQQSFSQPKQDTNNKIKTNDELNEKRKVKSKTMKDIIHRMYLGYSSNLQRLRDKFQDVDERVLKQYLKLCQDNFEDAFKQLKEKHLGCDNEMVFDYTKLYPSIYSMFTLYTIEPTTFINITEKKEFLKKQLENIENWVNSVMENDYCEDEVRFYKVQQTREEVYQIVKEATDKIGDYKMCYNGHLWNLCWSWTSQVHVDKTKMLVWQKVNHFSNAKQLARKDLLQKNIKRYQLQVKNGEDFNIMPNSFILPQEYSDFVNTFEKRKIACTPNLWIIKPIASSRGRGIRLIKDISSLHYGDHVIAQQYIHNPLLCNGKKFDLRLYVLVTSFNPLEAFLYNEGFARFSSKEYTLDEKELDNLFIHLTNTAIQNLNDENEQVNKISLGTLKIKLQEEDISFNELWIKVIEVILKSLCCVEQQICPSGNVLKRTISPTNSFELYGYDILFDEYLNVWLLEVNASPSMDVLCKLDDIKKDLIKDTIELVDPTPFNHRELYRVLGKYYKAKKEVKPTKEELNDDFKRILGGKVPRSYGEMPGHMGNYQRIAPSKMYSRISKFKN
ncbi:hypothetical protein ABK040_015946 [Willaertia magna]